jgi:S-adenosylmethionine:tRNA ribosyltransferase-isomerase
MIRRTRANRASCTGDGWGSEGWTDIFIRPPYRFRCVGGLLANIHLPRSTLLMLVSAFGGHELVMRAYGEATRRGYRFYSYGDAMLLV